MNYLTHPGPGANHIYKDVKQEIADHIARLDCAGQRLPSERNWCDLLGVSRSTVRQALLAMETEGQVQRRRGSGWYVSAQPLRFNISNHLPFTYAAIQQGRMPSWKKISIEMSVPPARVAKILGSSARRKVPTIQVLFELDAVSVALETTYINPRFCSNPKKIDHSLPISDELRRISGGDICGEMSIKSSTCGSNVAHLMDVHAESPALLMIQQIGNHDNEATIAIIETIWRGNALELIVDQPARAGIS